MGQAVQSDWNAIENCTRSGLKKDEHKPLKKKKNLLVSPTDHLYYLRLEKEHLLVDHFVILQGRDRAVRCSVLFLANDLVMWTVSLKRREIQKSSRAKFSCLVFCVLLVICVRLRGIV